jgi:hypothetical protein
VIRSKPRISLFEASEKNTDHRRRRYYVRVWCSERKISDFKMYNLGLKSLFHRPVSLRLLVLDQALRFHRKPTNCLCLSLFMPNLLSAPCRTSLYLPDPSHLQPPKTSHPLPVWAVQHSLCKLLLKWYINHFCVLCECVC